MRHRRSFGMFIDQEVAVFSLLTVAPFSDSVYQTPNANKPVHDNNSNLNKENNGVRPLIKRSSNANTSRNVACTNSISCQVSQTFPRNRKYFNTTGTYDKTKQWAD